MRFRFVVPMLALLMSACDILGLGGSEHYVLESINSQSLPVDQAQIPNTGSATLKYMHGAFALWGDGDFFLDMYASTDALIYRDGSGSFRVVDESEEHGTYERHGEDVTLTFTPSGEVLKARVTRDRVVLVREIIIDLDDEPDTLVFVRKR